MNHRQKHPQQHHNNTVGSSAPVFFRTMFGFAKKQQKKEDPVNARMHVIPDVFYGGNDPVIYHAKQEGNEQKQTHISHAPSSPASTKHMNPKKKKQIIIVGSVCVVGIVIALATWYSLRVFGNTAFIPGSEELNNSNISEISEVELIEEEPISTEVEESIVTSTETLEEEIVETKTPIEPVSFPRILLIDAQDSDSDTLTDEEEIIFSTQVDTWDTDGDGYYDGQEVVNLYNPNGFSPVKLIDSGLIAEYTNPVWQYRLYYPLGWEIGEVDTEFRQVLISTLSGDFVEVRVFDRESGISFQEWFSTHIEGEAFQDIRRVSNRFQEEGWRRKDGLVGYMPSESHVTVLIYHPGVTGAVPYRNMMRMILESFRPTKNTVVIPDQVVLPTPPASDTFTETTSTTSTIRE